MIFTVIFLLFFLSVVFTGVAIDREKWPRVFVAFGGMFTGLLMIPVAIQLFVIFHG